MTKARDGADCGPQDKIIGLGAYLRLSVEDDDKDVSNSINHQRQIIEEYVARHADLEIRRYYVDDGKTGMNYKRSGFMQMKADIDCGRIQGVIVKDLSRLGREHCDTIYLIKKEFRLKQIRFISIVDQIDLYGAHAVQSQDMSLPFKIIVNDVYCQNISNNIRIVQKAKQEEGLFIGSHARYGYRKDPNNKYHLIIDEEAAKVVRQIFRLALEGYNPGKIKHWLNRQGILSPTQYKQKQGSSYQCPKKLESTNYWTDSTVREILKSEMYIGNMVQHRKQKIAYDIDKTVNIPKHEQRIVEGTHEAIIDRESFQRVQTFLRQRSYQPDFSKVGMYKGLLFCGDCKRFLSKTTRARGVVYRCPTYAHYGAAYCSAHYLELEKLNDMLLQTIRTQVSKQLQTMKLEEYEKRSRSRHVLVQEEKSELLMLKKQKLQQEKAQMLRKLSQEVITDEDYVLYQRNYQDLMREVEEQIRQITELSSSNNAQPKKRQPWVDTLLQKREITVLKREILLHLVERIDVYEGGITIRFLFEDPTAEGCS